MHTEEELRIAVAALHRGALVAFPTETVYGLGADATNENAIRAVFTAKGRPADNPLIVHGASLSDLAPIAVFDARAERLAAQCWPGPLTMVLPARAGVSDLVRAGLPTVAVRVPDHTVALALLAQSGPLVAPSANRSGRPSPTTAQDVREELGDAVALVLDGGPCRVGIESTVLDLSAPVATILRPGALDAATLTALLGSEVRYAEGTADERPRSPGLKYRHYAPTVPVMAYAAPPAPGVLAPRTLVLTTPQHATAFDAPDVVLLESASLYGAFRRAERESRPAIAVVAAADELPAALWDRIQRAMHV
jgi:L-threonylcarbamoyladenylate synthase